MIVVARRAPRPNRPPLTGHRPPACGHCAITTRRRGLPAQPCRWTRLRQSLKPTPDTRHYPHRALRSAPRRTMRCTDSRAPCRPVDAQPVTTSKLDNGVGQTLTCTVTYEDPIPHGLWVWTTPAVVGQSSPCAKEARAWTPCRGQSYDVAVFTRDSRFTDWAYEVFTQPRPLMAGPPALFLLRVRGLRLLGLWIQPRRRDVGVGSRTGRRAHVLQRTTPLRFAKVSSAWPLCSTEASRTAAVVDCPDAFGIRRLSKISAQFFCLAGIDRS